MKKLLWIAGALAVLILIVVIALTFVVKSYLKSENLKEFIIPKAEEATGRDVEIESIDVSLFKGIVVKNIALKDSAGKADFVKVDRFILDYSLLPLLKKQLLIKEIRLDSPHIFIKRDHQGRFSFQDIIERQTKKHLEEKVVKKEGEKERKTQKLPVSIVTDKIIVSNAQINFIDEMKVLPEVKGASDMTFKVRIAEDIKKPEIEGKITLKYLTLIINNKEIKTTGTVSLDGEKILINMNTNVEGDMVEVKGKVTNYLTKPDIEKNIYSKSLDLEKIMALIPSKKKEPAEPLETKGKIVKSKGEVKTGERIKEKASPLNITAHGQMKVDRARFKGYEIKDFLLQFAYRDEILSLKPLKCEITGGDVIDAEGKAEGEFRLRYSTVADDPLGVAKKTLKGRLIARLLKGEIKKSEITEALASFTGIDDLRRFTFNKANFDLVFEKERINVDGSIDSDHIKLDPKGVVDFEYNMDLKADMKVSPELTSRISKNLSKFSFLKDEKGWLIIPLKMTGTAMKPSVGLDTSRAGKAVEKKIKKEIEKRLKEKMIPKRKEGEKETRPEDLIKGLFGK